MLVKRLLTLTLLAALTVFFAPKQASAQYYDGVNMKGKIIVGTNVGFGMSSSSYTNWLNFEFSPQVGYRITDQLEVGTRLVYHLEFAKSNRIDSVTGHTIPGERYSCNYLGVAPYVNFEFWRGFYIKAEYEGVYGFAKETSSTGQTINSGRWYNSLPIGIGYRYYLGEIGFIYIAGFYNVFDFVNETEHTWALSPYNSPWIAQVGFCWGI